MRKFNESGGHGDSDYRSLRMRLLQHYQDAFGTEVGTEATEVTSIITQLKNPQVWPKGFPYKPGETIHVFDQSVRIPSTPLQLLHDLSSIVFGKHDVDTAPHTTNTRRSSENVKEPHGDEGSEEHNEIVDGLVARARAAQDMDTLKDVRDDVGNSDFEDTHNYYRIYNVIHERCEEFLMPQLVSETDLKALSQLFKKARGVGMTRRMQDQFGTKWTMIFEEKIADATTIGDFKAIHEELETLVGNPGVRETLMEKWFTKIEKRFESEIKAIDALPDDTKTHFFDKNSKYQRYKLIVDEVHDVRSSARQVIRSMGFSYEPIVSKRLRNLNDILMEKMRDQGKRR